jgi:hypothetical protein
MQALHKKILSPNEPRHTVPRNNIDVSAKV